MAQEIKKVKKRYKGIVLGYLKAAKGHLAASIDYKLEGNDGHSKWHSDRAHDLLIQARGLLHMNTRRGLGYRVDRKIREIFKPVTKTYGV